MTLRRSDPEEGGAPADPYLEWLESRYHWEDTQDNPD